MFRLPTRAHYNSRDIIRRSHDLTTRDPKEHATTRDTDEDEKMTRSVWALAAIALLISACAAPKTEEFTTQDAAAIRQKNQEFVQAFNAKQLPQILELYAENSVFMPPNMPIIRGKEALKNYYADLLNQGAGSLWLDVAEVSGHGPIAYQTGPYELEYKPASGPGRHDRGKYLFVLRNMSGTWRLQHTMWNSDLPIENLAPAAE
jgi:ketosteroid isomerase-like protein